MAKKYTTASQVLARNATERAAHSAAHAAHQKQAAAYQDSRRRPMKGKR